MMQENRHRQNSQMDVIYEDAEDTMDSFQVPLYNEHNKQIFQTAQQVFRITTMNKEPQKPISNEDDDENVSFMLTNLDTGQSNITNVREVMIKTQSFKKKELKMKQDQAWYDFWKKVYRKNQQLRGACERGDLNDVKAIVQKKESDYPIDINSKGFDNWTALHFASYEDHSLIAQYLLSHGADINCITRFGKTALHIACIRGNIKTIVLLIFSKIDINFQDEDGNTALHIATQNGYEDVVQLLIESNALILNNNNNISPLNLIPESNKQIKQIFEKKNVKVSQSISQSADMSKNKSKILEVKNKIVKTQLEDIKLTTESFIYYKLLGKGAFGEVFLVQRKGEDELYALKVLSKQKIFGRGLVKYAVVERNIMRVMNHPFIVKLNYSFQNQNKLFMVMEYCPGGDLGKVLLKKKVLTQNQTRLYLSQLVLAFEALHKNMIVFRDLKPDNVILDAEGHVKLTDFGLSKQGVYNNSTQSFCGSVAYLAPQILLRQGHTRTVDWYLLGQLAYELLVGRPPYYNEQKQVLLENIKKATLKIPSNLSDPAKDLIKRLLSRDPTKRLGSERDASEVREHPFFQNIDWIDVMNRKLIMPKIDLPKINLNQTIKVSFDDKKEGKGRNNLDRWTYINNN